MSTEVIKYYIDIFNEKFKDKDIRDLDLTEECNMGRYCLEQKLISVRCKENKCLYFEDLGHSETNFDEYCCIVNFALGSLK